MIDHNAVCTVRIVVVQGPLPGHLPDRRVWLCHLVEGSPLMPGCSKGGPAMPLFLPEECLHPTGEGVQEPINIIDGDTLFAGQGAKERRHEDRAVQMPGVRSDCGSQCRQQVRHH